MDVGEDLPGDPGCRERFLPASGGFPPGAVGEEVLVSSTTKICPSRFSWEYSPSVHLLPVLAVKPASAQGSACLSARLILRKLAVLLFLAPVWLSGCLKAVTVDGDYLRGPVSFARPEGWRVLRNYRWLGGSHVILDSREMNASLAVELLPAGKKADDLPMGLLAEIIVGNLGRSHGVETLVSAEYNVVLADRLAIAMVGTRRHGPRLCDFTALVARTSDKLLLLHLFSPPGTIQTFAPVMETVMNTLTLPGEPVPPTNMELP